MKTPTTSAEAIAAGILKKKLEANGLYLHKVGRPALLELGLIIAEPIPAGTTRQGGKPGKGASQLGVLVKHGLVRHNGEAQVYQATEFGHAYGAKIAELGVLA